MPDAAKRGKDGCFFIVGFVVFVCCFKQQLLLRRIAFVVQKRNAVVDYVNQVFPMIFDPGQPFMSNDGLLFQIAHQGIHIILKGSKTAASKTLL